MTHAPCSSAGPRKPIPFREIHSVAKTVADGFRFRNQIGNAVANEALKIAWTDRKAKVDDIVAQAKLGHVDNVMRPHLEIIS
jgi:hypothetical protein